jgi:hypothetical protein
MTYLNGAGARHIVQWLAAAFHLKVRWAALQHHME